MLARTPAGKFQKSSWPADRVDELRLFIETKKSPTRLVADHFGITRNAVIGACRRHSIPLPIQRPKGPSKWTSERLAKMKSLHGEGLTIREIADGVGLSKSTVQSKLGELGLAKRVGGGKPGLSRTRKQPTIMDLARPPFATLNIPFIDLEPFHCRAVIENEGFGNALFCGHRVINESSYCRWHHSRFNESVVSRRKRNSQRPMPFRFAA